MTTTTNNTSQQYNNSVLESQDLNPDRVTLGEVVLRHNKEDIERLIPLSTHNNKGYYVMTDVLPPNSIKCYSKDVLAKSGNKFISTSFVLKGRDVTEANTKKILEDNEEDDVDISVNKDNDDVVKNSVIDNSKNLANNVLINKLNTFITGITNRIKYMMMVPKFHPKKSYTLSMNTIKLEEGVKYRNIIEYEDRKNNLDLITLREVLKLCSYKILLKINYLLITKDNVVLNARIVRVVPETLDVLSATTKINVLKELNKNLLQNMDRYNTLMGSIDTQFMNAYQAKDELKKLFGLPTSDVKNKSNTNRYTRSKYQKNTHTKTASRSSKLLH